jgi:cellulose synthase/poly-beta-1,6-N-acetylglucosamine synthase-like glycosyltransferase
MLLAIAVASSLLVYTYLGYPVLIAIAGRLRPREQAPPGQQRPRVSVLVAAYNAADWVPGKLDSLLAQSYPHDRLEILVCSDASSDATDPLLAAYAQRDARIRVFRAERRKGKPAALNLLRRHATGEVLIMTDIRQPLSRGAVAALVSRLADAAIGCASGNLVLHGERGPGLYWRYESWIRRSEARFRGMVGAAGALYAIRRADVGDIPEDLILDDMWIPSRVQLDGRRIDLVAEAQAFDEAFSDRRELERKIRTLAGNYQLFRRVPRLLLPGGNPLWFETVSHKLLRLLCPWALLVLGACSVLSVTLCARPRGGGLHWGLWALVIAQGAFYLAALLGRRCGRVGQVARTFVLFHFAALAGLWRFARGSQHITW